MVIPFDERYLYGCIDVLQYLWKGSFEERLRRFFWQYKNNPANVGVLAVIAIDDNENVVGFRGWIPGHVSVGIQDIVIVRAADVVVHPIARRRGIFEDMTSYSLRFLKDKGISVIVNLSSNKYSNPGYQKLGWVSFSTINMSYKLSLLHKMVSFPYSKQCGEEVITVSQSLPSNIHIPDYNCGKLAFEKNDSVLRWYESNPDRHYLFAWSSDAEGSLTSFFVLSSTERKGRLDYFFAKSLRVASKVFSTMLSVSRCQLIAVWGFALPDEKKKQLRRLGFIRIPFYEAIMKKPPLLVKTLSCDGNWSLSGLDIRDVKNWEINAIDIF